MDFHGMSDSTRQSSSVKDRAYGVACCGLGVMAFMLLLLVGISFSLNERTVIIEKTVEKSAPAPQPATDDRGGVAAPPELVPPAPTSGDLRQRTVEEMLREADAVVPGGDDAQAVDVEPARSNDKRGAESKLPPAADEVMPPMTHEVAQLVKAARYAQIEGDMRLAVLKLEQALRLEPENPVVLYYYGLTYEWLRNADKSREFFLKVYMQREKAGRYFKRAATHLQTGFASPADMRGDMAFGPILEYRDPECPAGERVKLTVPVLMKDGLNVRPEDLHIRIQFFDKVNDKKVEMTRAPQPAIRWTTEPVDWADGEEIMEVTYYMPPLTEEEMIAFGSLKYYGYTAKLYYKGEPMDCHATPPVLFLLEQMKRNAPSGLPEYYEGDDGLLPPVEAVPASDDHQEGLLP